jgi:type I restriction enzyme S subunit
MRPGWPLVSVAELQRDGVLLVEDGNHGENRPRRDEFVPKGTAFVRAADLDAGRVRFDHASRIDDTALRRIRKGIGHPGDVLLSHKGTVGKLALVPDDAPPFVCSPQTTFWRTLDPDRLDRRFLYYFMRSAVFRRQLDARRGETDMADYVSLTAQRTFSVLLPPIAEQRQIATELGQLDDKIDLNGRLVEVSIALASHWFAGWRSRSEVWPRTTFGEFARVYGGSTPSTSNPSYWGGDVRWATPTDVTRLPAPYLFETERTITEDGLRACSSELHPPGSILMTSRATIGAFAVNQIASAANQGFVVVRPSSEHHRWYLFHEMLWRVDDMLERANGSTFLELSRGNFKQLVLPVPPDDELRALHATLDPLHERAISATRQSAILASLRDALLARTFAGVATMDEVAP